MTQELLENPIPESIQELLTIFNDDLAAVTFPDISAEVLENYAEQVRIKALELQVAQARVLSTKESLDASQNELLQRAARGLAYAKLYAEEREDLLEKLSSISLTGRAASTRGSEKRTRSRKAAATPTTVKTQTEETIEEE